jgi:two-component system, NarL family, invasion response regulator UvrY
MLGTRQELCHDDGVDTLAVTVLIADDQAPFRSAAKAVVGIAPGFEVVGEAASGEAAVELARTLAPDLVLMDIHLPGITGIEAARRIAGSSPLTLTFLVSSYQADDLPAEARSSGAAAYINKEDFEARLLSELWATRGDPQWRRTETNGRG